MFGVAKRSQRDNTVNGSLPNDQSTEEEDEFNMDEETYERRAKLCSVRKRSVEIPLENLLSGVVFLSGGRDIREGPVLSISHPKDVDVELLMEMSMAELQDMLTYFTFVPSEEVRNKMFSVVIAADLIHDFFLRKIIQALNQFEQSNHLINMVYVLCSSRDPLTTNYLNWSYNIDKVEAITTVGNGMEACLPIMAIQTIEKLHNYIKPDQLTEEFGGTFQYEHQDWVRFRMQVEPFICDVVGVSKRLVEAITPFNEEENPTTIEEAEDSLKAHRIQRRKTLEHLHVDELASEGEKIKERLHTTSKEHLRVNPDFNATLKTIEVLLHRVDNIRSRLDELWRTKSDKLETKIKEKKFEKEANQIIEWFEQYAEEFFETNTDLGESLEVAQALVNELMEFEENTKEILRHTDILLKHASKLEGFRHVGSPVKDLGQKIKGYLIDYSLKMESRKKKLNNAVKLHNIMEKAINWCIEGVEFLGNYDILGREVDDMNPEYVKAQLVEFQSQIPSPSKEEIKMLTHAVSSMESHWGKESFQFALNRIIELHDRFELYHKVLDGMIADENQELQNGGNRVSIISIQSTDSQYSDTPDTISPIPPVVGRRTSVSGKEVQVTVLDMDKSVQQAITLLETTDTNTQHLTSSPNKEEVFVDSCTGPDCLSILDFLTELERPDSHSTTSLLSLPEMRSRSYSAPEDSTDGEIKRTRSFNRKNRQTISHGPSPTPSKHLDISMPSDPKFEDQPETVSLDDKTVEENPEDMTKQTANAKHRRRLMEELIKTEEAYINDLEFVCKNYMPVMDEDENLPLSLVGKKKLIFGLLPEFLQFSRDIVLPRIKKCMRAPIKMGLVFLDHEEDILQYALYFKNKPQQDELLTTEAQFFRSIQVKTCDQMGLFGYLIKPVQRMTKYKQFLEEMVKYSIKGKDQQDIQKGSKKEYFDKLKEALKMTDFVLRHGNDLLAIESLRGCEISTASMGRILRVGNLVIIDGFTKQGKHHRKVFLFENCILFAKTRRLAKTGPTGSDIYDFKQLYKTSELVLRENIPGHDARFALELKKGMVELQAESVDRKQEWVQEIWDLFFSHMLKLRDDNLQSHGTRGLSTPMLAGGNSNTLVRGRTLSHSMRKAKRLNTINVPGRNSEIPRNESLESINSIGSTTSLMEMATYMRNSRASRNFGSSIITGSGPLSPRSSVAVSFHEKYNNRVSGLSEYSTDMSSNRDSFLSTTSTISNGTMNHEKSNSPEASDPTSTLKKDMETLKEDSLYNDSFAESIHMYNTPV